jgi:hypothetical protein
MPRGGFRPNGGRPQGSRDKAPRNRPRLPREPEPVEVPTPVAPAEVLEKKGAPRQSATEDAVAYLQSVILDPKADVARKDRAAIALLGLHPKPAPQRPKRARQTEYDRILAGIGIPSFD